MQPKLVYISNPTELGTIYSNDELTAISQACRKNDFILYMDGARLGYALCVEGKAIDLPTIAKLCDAFYIGGTKNGALFGEALVIVSDRLKPDFRYILKQKGAMLAKGRLLGLQFIALFKNELYFDLARHANAMAQIIRKACVDKGYPFLVDSPTNQQFPILPNSVLQELGKTYEFAFWQKVDDTHSAVRFCTNWATKPADVAALAEDLLTY